jgi:hypothetical protein
MTSNGSPQGTWLSWIFAKAGFYYRGHCYSCKLKTSPRDWCHKVNEAPAEARLNRNCEHVVSNGFIPNPNIFYCPLLPCQVWFNLVQRFQRKRFKSDILSKYA